MRNATLIDPLFVGRVRPLPRDGHAPVASGIVKQARNGLLALSFNGVDGDEQGDPVFHGGPEKALHHYPGERYALWRALYPAPPAGYRVLKQGALFPHGGVTPALLEEWRLAALIAPLSPNWRGTFSRRVASRLIEDWTRRLHEPS